jgi:sporulation protein YlmC with PRC-barrel domain
MIVICGLATASTFAQTESTTTSSSTTYVQTSKLVGTKVKSSQGDEIGTIKDVVLDRNTGCMAYTVLSAGGGGTRVSGGGKMVAVPWAVYSPGTDVSVLTVTVDRDRIYNAPVFDYARIDEFSRPDYITNVYSYYGVSPGAAVGAGVSTGTTTGTTTTTGATTQTGAATRTGAAASPGAATSPAGTPSPQATRAPMGTASPAGRGSPSPQATAGRSPRATPGGRPHEAASPGTRGGATETSPTEKTRGTRGTREETTPPSGRGQTGSRSETSRPDTERPPSEGASTGERETGSRSRERSKTREAATPPEKPEGQ